LVDFKTVQFRNKIKTDDEFSEKWGLKVLAEYKEGLGWFDLDGYKLKDDIWVWVEELLAAWS
jgi:hypothetical protein